MTWYVYVNDPALEVYASDSEYTSAGFACYGEYPTQDLADQRVDEIKAEFDKIDPRCADHE